VTNDRAQLLRDLVPTARSLAHLQAARALVPHLHSALQPHLLLGRQRGKSKRCSLGSHVLGSAAVKAVCARMLEEREE
jgi:hypothetical protein